MASDYISCFQNTNVKFVEGKCKLWLKCVFKLWISELDWNRPLFLLTKTSREKMYWDGSESICVWIADSMNHDYRYL